ISTRRCAERILRASLKGTLPAGAISVAAVLDIEVEVIRVVAIITRPEHCSEIIAALGTHLVQQPALAEGEEAGLAYVDCATVVERNRHHVDGIAARMFRGDRCAVDLAA